MITYADSGNLNRYSAVTLLKLGFVGVIPYVGIGGGPSMPYKRLTQDRWEDYVASGIQVPAAFVENGIYDADGGYWSGYHNAFTAMQDVESMGANIHTIIAVNDKTEWNQNDVDYVRGFRDVLGHDRTGVYGFSDFLREVHSQDFASVYIQCGNSPETTGTSDFVHLWQRNDMTANDDLDINVLLLPLPESDTVANILDEVIPREGTDGEGNPQQGITSLRATVAWLDSTLTHILTKQDKLQAAVDELRAVNLTIDVTGTLNGKARQE